MLVKITILCIQNCHTWQKRQFCGHTMAIDSASTESSFLLCSTILYTQNGHFYNTQSKTSTSERLAQMPILYIQNCQKYKKWQFCAYRIVELWKTAILCIQNCHKSKHVKTGRCGLKVAILYTQNWRFENEQFCIYRIATNSNRPALTKSCHSVYTELAFVYSLGILYTQNGHVY